MPLPRFRLRTLMIALAVLSVNLAALTAVLHPVDRLVQARGLPIRTRIIVDTLVGLPITLFIVVGYGLAVQIVRRGIVLRSLLRRPSTELRR